MTNNKKYILAGLLLLVIVAGVVAVKMKKLDDNAILSFKERSGALAQSTDWAPAKKQMQDLIANIQANPNDEKSKLLLIQAYLEEGRVTGNKAFYDLAALKLVNNVLAKNANQFEAHCFKSSILLSQHHFQEGLDEANIAKRINSSNSYVYGLICDANVELGNYKKAIEAADTMAFIRPDLGTYSRQSYLNEIYGDWDRAIALMKLAVAAGVGGQESTSWCRVQLGKLYENRGNMDSAKAEYEKALIQRPDYPYALSGMARIARSQKDYPNAIANLLKASTIVDDNEFLDELSDVYVLANEKSKAEEVVKKMVASLEADAESGNDNDEMGHYADMELAYAYVKLGKMDKALEHALIEYNRRPANIEVNEALAWAYLHNDKMEDANKYIDVALKTTNCIHPKLLTRAGTIKIKSGKTQEGEALIKKANPTGQAALPAAQLKSSPSIATGNAAATSTK